MTRSTIGSSTGSSSASVTPSTSSGSGSGWVRWRMGDERRSATATVPRVRGHAVSAEEYLRPTVPAALPWRDLPIIATDHPSVDEVALLVHGDPDAFDVPIVPWPDRSGRPLDPGTGVGGGPVRGT